MLNQMKIGCLIALSIAFLASSTGYAKKAKHQKVRKGASVSHVSKVQKQTMPKKIARSKPLAAKVPTITANKAGEVKELKKESPKTAPPVLASAEVGRFFHKNPVTVIGLILFGLVGIYSFWRNRRQKNMRF